VLLLWEEDHRAGADHDEVSGLLQWLWMGSKSEDDCTMLLTYSILDENYLISDKLFHMLLCVQ
jgi:hypothetical protein